MENKQLTSKSEKTALEIVEKLPKELLTNHLNEYSKNVTIENYLRIVPLVFPILVIIHNLFIAGNSFKRSTYDNILITELTIVVITLIGLLILLGIYLKGTKKLNTKLKDSARRYGIRKQSMEEEFSFLALQFYGGMGVKLK